MIIDSDDDEPAKSTSQQTALAAEFEDEEEELDPDQPYLSLVQHLCLSLNTQVLHIAVPQIPVISPLRPADTVPPILGTKMIFTVACADSTIRIITLPLSPPPDTAKEKPLSAKSQFGEEIFKFHGHQSMSRGITMTWTAKGEPKPNDDANDEMDVDDGHTTTTPDQPHSQAAHSDGYDLVIASHSAELGGLLKIWRFNLAETSLKVVHPITPYKTLNLHKPASCIAFSSAQYPKSRHLQLLITDSTGIARIYDPLATSGVKRAASGGLAPLGAFVGTFRSSFESLKSNAHTPAILATRKSIIDAAWVLDGHHILALLADGEWGVWDVDRSGPSPPANPSAFSLRGFVGTSEKNGASSGASSPKRGSRGSLAPMTPNTRRKKEDNLFQGSSASSVAATRGGISVASSLSPNGAALENSVMIWYGSEVYRIAELAKFWARTASASRGNSLPGSGLQIYDAPLYGEAITSISQFDTTTQASHMAIPRDTLISVQHRLIIIVSTSQSLGRDLNAMFAQERVKEEETRRTDQVLLSRGELDLGGMDRLLEDMEGSGAISRSLTLGGGPRKVLFASSAT